MNIHEAMQKWRDQLGSIRGSVTDQMKNNLWDSARQRVSQGIVIHAFICDMAQVSDDMTAQKNLEIKNQMGVTQAVELLKEEVKNANARTADYIDEIRDTKNALTGIHKTKNASVAKRKLKAVISELETLC